ncbi:hypothetical protein [Azospirillum argentinense]
MRISIVSKPFMIHSYRASSKHLAPLPVHPYKSSGQPA